MYEQLEVNNKNKLCRFYEQGKCKFGENCKFSHQIVHSYFMRHAESVFNHMLESYEHDANSLQAKQSYQMDKNLIDCGLTEEGLSQIDSIKFPHQIRINQQRIKFDLIFVSPLERCLKTTERCLKKHKIRTKKVIVLPSLTEVLSKICDFSHSIQQKMKKYENFDFSYLMKHVERGENYWQDFLVDPEFQLHIEQKEEYGHRYIKILDSIFPQPLQNSNRCFMRAMEAISQIKQICKEEKANKILVVSHNRIIKYIMGRNSKGRAESIRNCEIKYTTL